MALTSIFSPKGLMLAMFEVSLRPSGPPGQHHAGLLDTTVAELAAQPPAPVPAPHQAAPLPVAPQREHPMELLMARAKENPTYRAQLMRVLQGSDTLCPHDGVGC